MKRLCLALFATLVLPTAVSAESVWLVLGAEDVESVALEKIQMKDMAQCIKQGEIYRSAKSKNRDKSTQGLRVIVKSFICLEGK